MIVADSSVLFEAIVDDGELGEDARSAIAADDLVAPDLVDLEVVSAIRNAVIRGLLLPQRAAQAIDDLRFFPIKRERHELLLTRAWDLHANVTPYDAVYIALAEFLEIPFLTRDGRLARAPGIECEVQLLESPN